MQHTVVFLDLDGTLWEWGEVPASAQQAIRDAQANGHKVLSNTGRARSEVPDMSAIGLDGYCFAAGAEVILDGERIVHQPLGADIVRRIAGIFDEFGVNYNLEAGEACWLKVNDRAAYERLAGRVDAEQDPIMHARPVDEMTADEWASVLKTFYHGAGPVYEQVAARMPEGITFTYLAPGFAEATSERVTKATAMEAVRAHLGSDWRTMALGDSDNDLPMLRAADVSVAMGNGNDNAKAAADWVTTDIHADGLLNAFRHFGLV